MEKFQGGFWKQIDERTRRWEMRKRKETDPIEVTSNVRQVMVAEINSFYSPETPRGPKLTTQREYGEPGSPGNNYWQTELPLSLHFTKTTGKYGRGWEQWHNGCRFPPIIYFLGINQVHGKVPFGILKVAPERLTMHGIPYSLAMTAPWEMRPPISVTRPAMRGK